MYQNRRETEASRNLCFLQRITRFRKHEPNHLINLAPLPAKRARKVCQINKDGGAYRDRTDDPLLAKQVLSQLS
jgi:hypothetical protein